VAKLLWAFGEPDPFRDATYLEGAPPVYSTPERPERWDGVALHPNCLVSRRIRLFIGDDTIDKPLSAGQWQPPSLCASTGARQLLLGSRVWSFFLPSKPYHILADHPDAQLTAAPWHIQVWNNFAIEEGNEYLAVIFGNVWLWKTTTVRIVLDSLEQGKHPVAFVANPDMTFIQLLRVVTWQLLGELCNEGRREQILAVFNQLLFETQAEGKKVLIFIDEANAMKPSTLESLRLLTNTQGDDENLFTIILASRLELAKRLEPRKCADLFQRIGVYRHLAKIESQDLMQ
jgi:hypothetical protein